MGSSTRPDSRDEVGQHDMHAFEVASHFDAPIGKK